MGVGNKNREDQLTMIPWFLISGIVSGICWTVVYLLIIRQGFRDKTYGMPIVALGANLSWEFLFSVVFPHRAPQLYINFIWLTLDLVILYQIVKYWRNENPELPSSTFFSYLAVVFALTFGAVLAITLEFQDFNGMYSAFGQNLMMSVLFIAFFFKRNGARGQSTAIGLFKLVGTASASFGFYYLEMGNGYLLPFLYVTILLLDITYVILVWQVNAGKDVSDVSKVDVVTIRKTPESVLT